MLKENSEEEKVCLFFTSDYHFEMIILPYINKELKQGKNIIVMSENDLTKTVDKLLSQINLEKEEKDKISKIDWKNNDVDKFKEIKNANQEGNDIVVFVKGRENYINSINKNIGNWINFENVNVQIIDCYDLNNIKNDIKSIVSKYGKVLSTTGIEKIL